MGLKECPRALINISLINLVHKITNKKRLENAFENLHTIRNYSVTASHIQDQNDCLPYLTLLAKTLINIFATDKACLSTVFNISITGFWVSIMGYWVFSCIVYYKAHGPIC
jgi:hypothetical protein